MPGIVFCGCNGSTCNLFEDFQSCRTKFTNDPSVGGCGSSDYGVILLAPEVGSEIVDSGSMLLELLLVSETKIKRPAPFTTRHNAVVYCNRKFLTNKVKHC